ncbi:signal recognition particle receptor subunit alpha [Ascodesmis nigricans]|uniref:Signal recognition particle receptor subunit alpha homolog n=1 Tax=Ascodesmis nigricans TaxID=341454 RepID=A0A4S2N0X6_9PEZI|nr:signal recognition particle receptor subunit alpha [Ascodesmis nigricans]
MASQMAARSALDSFEVLTTSGILLWSKKYSPVNDTIVNSFISDVLIEERVQPGSDGKSYKKDSYTLKWTTANDLGLIFIAVYQSLLQITWIDELLETVKTLFTTLYGDQLRKPHTSTIECHFDDYFDTRIRDLEKQYGGPAPRVIPTTGGSPPPSTDVWGAPPPVPGLIKTPGRPSSPIVNGTLSSETPDISRPISPGTARGAHLVAGKRTRGGRGRRGGSRVSSSEVSPAPSNGKKGGKKARRWDSDGGFDDGDDVVLDYSAQSDGTDAEDNTRRPVEHIDLNQFGSKTSSGDFVLRDLGDDINSILASKSTTSGAGSGTFSFLRSFVGGKALTKEDMDKAVSSMREHLLRKNVAQEAANEILRTVEVSLIGHKTGTFESINNVVRAAVESAIRKILTPTSSLDLLREIHTKRTKGSRPYVISIVGVNGVGKSTNLSKICFFLLQNKFKVLIAACDTFRSGAVEQLRVHARNLKELSEREGGVVELYEKGYGKDAANIAKDAVTYAEQSGFDVVLIDTAGRRHNDQRLMSSLEKFAKFAMPDKIFMVGEALVGTDSVAQARNFNAAFGIGRRLDGFIISKCDTVGDMVRTCPLFNSQQCHTNNPG